MCGGPPGNPTKMTEVSGTSFPSDVACARRPRRFAIPRPPRDAEENCRNDRRVSGPGHFEWDGIKRSGRKATEDYLRIPEWVGKARSCPAAGSLNCRRS